MKTRAEIAAELKLALRAIEVTPDFLQVVKTGTVTKAQVVQFLEDALAVALDQTYIAFAERAGGVPSIRQIASAERAALFADMASGSLASVQDVALRSTDKWTDARLRTEIKRAVLLNDKDAKALANYDDELKTGDTKSRQRKLRDRRFDRTARKGKVSAAKRRLMVGRYRDRLAAFRTASIARDTARAAEAVAVFGHWSDRAAAGDQEAAGARKFWDNRADGKVRDSHVHIPQDYPDGLPLDEGFVTRWGIMRYPHDSQGHPNDRDGCRCKLRIEKART